MATERSNQIFEEMVQLSVDTIQICQRFSLFPSVADHTTGPVASIGANFSEVQDASAKKYFINKVYIAKKEASETRYWFAVILKLMDSSEIPSLINQTQKFVMMLQKIVNNSRRAIVNSSLLIHCSG